MRVETMEELFIGQIQDLYDAEKQLVKALPKMAEAATSLELRSAFEDHLEQTKGHVKRLDQVFTEAGKKAAAETCEAMKGLIEEGEEIISNIKKSPLRDVGLIAAANRVEHYEIAGYGTARTLAESLGLKKSASLLEETLEEEKEADEKLTELAVEKVNPEALGARTKKAG